VLFLLPGQIAVQLSTSARVVAGLADGVPHVLGPAAQAGDHHGFNGLESVSNSSTFVAP
jgi:hypothetical protein